MRPARTVHGRGTVDVILDLTIYDPDAILSLTSAEVASVQADPPRPLIASYQWYRL